MEVDIASTAVLMHLLRRTNTPRAEPSPSVFGSATARARSQFGAMCAQVLQWQDATPFQDPVAARGVVSPLPARGPCRTPVNALLFRSVLRSGHQSPRRTVRHSRASSRYVRQLGTVKVRRYLPSHTHKPQSISPDPTDGSNCARCAASGLRIREATRLRVGVADRDGRPHWAPAWRSQSASPTRRREIMCTAESAARRGRCHIARARGTPLLTSRSLHAIPQATSISRVAGREGRLGSRSLRQE